MRATSHTHFPHLVTVASVEEIKGADFVQVLQRCSFSSILVGRGSPCQGNSILNTNRKGWHDERLLQPLELKRIISQFEQVQAASPTPVPVLGFLENVATAP